MIGFAIAGAEARKKLVEMKRAVFIRTPFREDTLETQSSFYKDHGTHILQPLRGEERGDQEDRIRTFRSRKNTICLWVACKKAELEHLYAVYAIFMPEPSTTD